MESLQSMQNDLKYFVVSVPGTIFQFILFPPWIQKFTISVVKQVKNMQNHLAVFHISGELNVHMFKNYKLTFAYILWIIFQGASEDISEKLLVKGIKTN